LLGSNTKGICIDFPFKWPFSLFSFKDGDQRRCNLTIYNLESRAAAIHHLIATYLAKFAPPPPAPAAQIKGLTGINRACRRAFHQSLGQLTLSLTTKGTGPSVVAAPGGDSRNYKPVLLTGSSFQRKGLRKSFTFTSLGLYGDKKKANR
jgi:hypothetical protein